MSKMYSQDYTEITRYVGSRPSRWPVAGIIAGAAMILFIVAVLVLVKGLGAVAGEFTLHALLELAAGL